MQGGELLVHMLFGAEGATLSSSHLAGRSRFAPFRAHPGLPPLKEEGNSNAAEGAGSAEEAEEEAELEPWEVLMEPTGVDEVRNPSKCWQLSF